MASSQTCNDSDSLPNGGGSERDEGLASDEEKGTKQGIENRTNMHSTPASPAQIEIQVSVVAPANSRKQVLPQCRICWENHSGQEDPLLRLGCSCVRELSRAHRSCITKFFGGRVQQGLHSCEICSNVLRYNIFTLATQYSSRVYNEDSARQRTLGPVRSDAQLPYYHVVRVPPIHEPRRVSEIQSVYEDSMCSDTNVWTWFCQASGVLVVIGIICMFSLVLLH